MTLPLYPQLKTRLENLFVKFVEAAAEEALGPLSDVQRTTQYEGQTLEYNTLDGHEKKIEYQAISANFGIKNSDIPAMTIEDVVAKLSEMGKEIGTGQARHSFKVIHDTTEEAGNVVDSKGKPLTLDVFFEAVEKIQISFDEDGNPQMPTIVIPPQMAEPWQKIIEESKSPEATQKMQEVLGRKKKEWHEEESRRKLVD